MSPNIQVIVFTQGGCPACEEYVPRFKALAAPYAGHLPIHVVDCDDARAAPHADRLRVTSTPTTFVLRRGGGVIKHEGAATNEQITRLLQTAYAYR